MLLVIEVNAIFNLSRSLASLQIQKLQEFSLSAVGRDAVKLVKGWILVKGAKFNQDNNAKHSVDLSSKVQSVIFY